MCKTKELCIYVCGFLFISNLGLYGENSSKKMPVSTTGSIPISYSLGLLLKFCSVLTNGSDFCIIFHIVLFHLIFFGDFFFTFTQITTFARIHLFHSFKIVSIYCCLLHGFTKLISSSRLIDHMIASSSFLTDNYK